MYDNKKVCIVDYFVLPVIDLFQLGVAPSNCLAIEDSLNSLLFAKAAKLRCVLVPAPEHRNHLRWAIADQVLDRLDEFDLSGF